MKRVMVAIILPILGISVSAHGQSVSRGDRLTVTVDEAAVIDSESNVLTRVKRAEAFTVSYDYADPIWIPIAISINGEIKNGWISRDHVRFVGVGERYMSLILAVVIHVLVGASILLMVVFIWRTIFDDRDSTERLIRAASVGTGLLAYCAARAYGFSIPDLLASAITTVGPVQFGVVGAVVPGATGAFVAGICIRMIKENQRIGTRATLLFAAFMFTMFADVYATLAGDISGNAGRYGLPNATFVLGLMLWTIFRYKRK